MVETHAALTVEQERQRRDGLRILARIIARHYLESTQGRAADRDAVRVVEPEPSTEPKSKDGPMPDAEDAR